MNDNFNNSENNKMFEDVPEIFDLYKSALKKRLGFLSSWQGLIECEFDEDMSQDYLDIFLTEEERKRFEEHYPGCPVCLKRLLDIIDADEKASRDFKLGDIGQKRSLDAVLERLASKKKDELTTEGPLLLAAATSGNVFKKSAFGIGVDPESKDGQFLECIVQLSEDKKTEEGLQIIGSQVEEREIYGKRIKGTPPFMMMKDVLSVLLVNMSFFRRHDASKRNITIQIAQQRESYLDEGQSLSLAAASALYCVFEKRKLSPRVVFTGSLDIAGSVKKISHLNLKVRTVKKNGGKVLVLPSVNRPDLDLLSDEDKKGIEFKFCDSLDDLFAWLDTVTIQDESAETTIKGQQKAGPARYGLIAGLVVLAAICVTFILSRVVDKVDFYNRTKPLHNVSPFSMVLSDIPNYPVLEFEKQVRSGDIDLALAAAEKVKVQDDYLNHVFIPLADLMIEKKYSNFDIIIKITRRFLNAAEIFSREPGMMKKIEEGERIAVLLAKETNNPELLKMTEKYLPQKVQILEPVKEPEVEPKQEVEKKATDKGFE